ncbi:Carotene biosynthesis-related protein CBR [Chlorella vulgaris]
MCGRAAEAAESVNCAHADRSATSLPPFLQAINPGGWTRTQEVSNGRAAIAGLVAAFIAEKTVHTSAFDQLFGAAGGAPWAKPLFFAVVAVFIGITATERKATGNQPISGNPNSSPFSPELRLNAGRAAMVGFSALMIVRGSRTTVARPAARLVRAGSVKNDPPRNDGSSADDRLAKDPAINPGGWTRTQEVSNGRAAIAGLVAAFIAEKTVHTSAFDQLFGAAGGAPWAKPLFFAVVAVFIGITATERKATGNQPISGNPNSSPFSPELRLNAGRAAMVGFSALMIVRGSRTTVARPAARLIVRAGPVKNDPPRNDGSSADDRLAKDPAINPGGWTRTQEVSNGRAAIAGLVAAFIAEKTVHTSAFDQLFGAAGGAPWAKPLFFAVVAVFIGITATERKATGNQPISGNPNSSPFSPELRLNAGRAAMVGFSALMIVRGSRTTVARPAARLIVRAGPVKNDPPRNDGSSADDRLAKDPAINPGGWTRTQEVSNGRAAIAGLVAAFIAEKTVHTSAFDQLFGAAGGAPWAKPLFFAVVAVFIGITATERKATGNQPISGNPDSSPFSPELRLNAGRAAMVGFSALMVWEATQGRPFFG